MFENGQLVNRPEAGTRKLNLIALRRDQHLLLAFQERIDARSLHRSKRKSFWGTPGVGVNPIYGVPYTSGAQPTVQKQDRSKGALPEESPLPPKIWTVEPCQPAARSCGQGSDPGLP